MTGSLLKEILEDVADNLFNTDPYYQQGGDMVRVGGMGYTIDAQRADGQSRISDMTLLKTGEAVEADKEYTRSPAGHRSTRNRRPGHLGCRREAICAKNPVVKAAGQQSVKVRA
jgi:sulfur-oxidizing protein SoxB